jgi:hypothetical protein
MYKVIKEDVILEKTGLPFENEGVLNPAIMQEGNIHYSEELPKVNSDYISEKLGYDYTYLANTFSDVKGFT